MGLGRALYTKCTQHIYSYWNSIVQLPGASLASVEVSLTLVENLCWVEIEEGQTDKQIELAHVITPASGQVC